MPAFTSMRLESFAGQFDICYHSFRRLFKRRTGLSLRQYALDARIHRAKDTVLRSDKPIHEISKELGFTTASYFSRLFKKKTGHWPSELRRQTAP